MTTRTVSFPRFTEERMRVHRASEALRRDGASPAGALDLLAALVEGRDWERLEDSRARLFAGRFRDFVEAPDPYGLGFPVDQLRKVLEMRHPHEQVADVAARMDRMRSEIYRMLAEAVEPAKEHRRPTLTESANKDGTTTFISHSNDASHTVARLKRDDPALAEKVVNGEISPYAAARAKGWRKPRVLLTSPESIARALRQHLDPDDLAELVRLLQEPTDG